MLSLLTLTLAVAPAVPCPQAQSHLGEYMGTVDALSRPVAATFGPAGSVENALWVAEAGSAVNPAGLRALSGIDSSFTGRSAGRTVARAGVGVLEGPSGVAVDGEGIVYATDNVLHAVWKFGRDGSPTQLAGKGEGIGQVMFPADIEVWPRHSGKGTHLLVADPGNRRAQLLNLASGEWTELRADGIHSDPSAVAFVPQRAPQDSDPDDESASAPPARIIVADGARHQLDLFSLDGRYASSFSDWGFFPSLVSSPSGVECVDGLFFVADTDNHRVQAFDAERPADPTDGLRYRFGIHAIRPGEGDGSLHYPTDIAIDRDAVILAIVEPLDDRIQLFGRGAGATPKPDPTRAGLGAPSAHMGELISASGQYLVTLSPESHQVLAHDLRSDIPTKISELFGFGQRLGMLRRPVGLHLSGSGQQLLVTDEGNRRLTRATLNVKPDETLRQDPKLETVLDAIDLGAFGIIPGDVTAVDTGSADSPATLIAVVDRRTDTVALFDNDLQLVRRIGESKNDPIVGIVGVTATPQGTLLLIDGHGGRLPEDKGQVRKGRVVEFSVDGTRLASFGAGLLNDPSAAVCHGLRVWVTDAGRDRVEIFDRAEPEGPYEHTSGFGEKGLGRAQFHEPRGLALTGDNRLIVLDHGNHRGQIFGLEGNFLDGFGGRLYTAPLRAFSGKTR